MFTQSLLICDVCVVDKYLPTIPPLVIIIIIIIVINIIIIIIVGYHNTATRWDITLLSLLIITNEEVIEDYENKKQENTNINLFEPNNNYECQINYSETQIRQVKNKVRIQLK